MTLRMRMLRLLAGAALLATLLAALFAVVIPAIHRWGATDAEIARAMPGDDQLPHPAVTWTNAIDISAPPAQVWPWVAQLGDTRGGFYSFTFIENRVGALTGASDYAVVYRNADRIVPAWQHPAPGDSMLQGIKLRAEGGVEPWWMERAEISLWLTAVLCGLIAAVLFVFRPAWRRPLAVASAAVVALFILTFVQPPIAVRVVLDAALIGATWWAYRAVKPSQSAAPRVHATSP